MAGGIYVNGQLRRVPGIRANPIDTTQLAGTNPGIGQLGVVGYLPELEPNAIYRFTSAKALQRFCADSLDLALIADIAWGASPDTGNPAAVTLVNAQTTTQAKKILQDSTAEPSVQLAAAVWGLRGNTTFASFKSNASDIKKTDISLRRNGQLETYSAVGSGDVVAFQCTSRDLKPNATATPADTSTVALSNDGVDMTTGWCNVLTWAWARHMWMGSKVSPVVMAAGTDTYISHGDLVSCDKLQLKALAAGLGVLTDKYTGTIAGIVDTDVIGLHVNSGPPVTLTISGHTPTTAATALAALLNASVDATIVKYTYAGIGATVVATHVGSGVTTDTVSFSATGTGTFTPVHTTTGAVATGVSLTVTGTDGAGVAVTGLASLTGPFGSGDTADLVAVADLLGHEDGDPIVFSSIDTITWDKAGAYTTAPALLGTAFALALKPNRGYPKVANIITHIANFAGNGWTAVAKSPLVGAVPGNQLDAQAAPVDALAKGGAVYRADTWSIVKALANSMLVTATRSFGDATSGLLPPQPWNQTAGTIVSGLLLGGTEPTPGSEETAYIAAFRALEQADVQVVVPLTTDLASQQAADAHTRNAPAALGSERNAYCGSDALESVADIKTRINGLSADMSVLGQTLPRQNPLTGDTEQLDPMWAALLAAAMQCGRPIGEPLTERRPRIQGVPTQSWTMGDDDEDVIGAGIYAFTKSDQGYIVLRSITCYTADDNTALTEVSTRESLKMSVRDLRANLKVRVGTTATGVSPGQFRRMIEERLNKQVTLAMIAAWKDLVLEQVGDLWNIEYSAAGIEPFNFGLVTLHAYSPTTIA